MLSLANFIYTPIISFQTPQSFLLPHPSLSQIYSSLLHYFSFFTPSTNPFSSLPKSSHKVQLSISTWETHAGYEMELVKVKQSCISHFFECTWFPARAGRGLLSFHARVQCGWCSSKPKSCMGSWMITPVTSVGVLPSLQLFQIWDLQPIKFIILHSTK